MVDQYFVPSAFSAVVHALFSKNMIRFFSLHAVGEHRTAAIRRHISTISNRRLPFHHLASRATTAHILERVPFLADADREPPGLSALVEGRHSSTSL